MNNRMLRLKISQRLNKLSSGDFDNIESWMIAEAFNKAQLIWVRKQLEGINTRKQGDEGSMSVIDDIEILLTERDLDKAGTEEYCDVFNLPDNYLNFKRIRTKARDLCEECPAREMKVYFTQVGNEETLRSDVLHKPSLVWGETFCNLKTRQVRVFHNGEFSLLGTKLVYYRVPRMVSFAGYTDPNTGQPSTDVTCEFKDDVCEVILDECVSILASDIENTVQVQLSNTRNVAQS